MKVLLIGAGNRKHLDIKMQRVVNGEDEFDEITTLDLAGADINHDLEFLPLPIETAVYDEIHAYEVLEHTGVQGDFKFFFEQFNEFHRILKEGGYFCGSVPRHDSIWAWGDPGHKRVLPECVFNFLVEDFYTQVGDNPCADYRPWIKGYWQAEMSYHDDDRFFFVLKK